MVATVGGMGLIASPIFHFLPRLSCGKNLPMFTNSLTPDAGFTILLCYGLVMIGLTLWVSWGREKTKKEFLLANRGVGLIAGSMSIAASWIWAPAMFVAAQKTYQQGVAGLFWYIVPNIGTLIIFGPFAAKLRTLLPDGYTLPQYMRMQHGPKVHFLYLFQFFTLQICALAVQILAISSLLHTTAGIPFPLVGAIVVGIVLTYAVIGGLRASVATDYLQMVAMIVICVITVPWAVSRAGGFQSVLGGLGGSTGAYTNPLDPWVFYSFGISITIGLLSGPLGDQMQWQRAYALSKNGRVRLTFLIGALLFGSVPLCLSQLGFLAANPAVSQGWTITDPQMIGPTAIAQLLPHTMIVLYVVMVLAGLCSTMDSSLCAIASLVATDIYGSKGDEDDAHHRSVKVSRYAMLAAAVFGYLVAQIPNLQILHLFLFYGTLRASTMIPTILTLMWPEKLDSKRVFPTILTSIILGASLMAAGHFWGNVHLSVSGSLLVVVVGVLGCIRPKGRSSS